MSDDVVEARKRITSASAAATLAANMYERGMISAKELSSELSLCAGNIDGALLSTGYQDIWA